MDRSSLSIDRFYPIVPDLAWMQRLVPLGVKTIQLRLKEAAPAEVRRQITGSIEICRQHGCLLIINDYWHEALELGADYIHLGQEDLAIADVAAIKAERDDRLAKLEAGEIEEEGIEAWSRRGVKAFAGDARCGCGGKYIQINGQIEVATVVNKMLKLG